MPDPIVDKKPLSPEELNDYLINARKSSVIRRGISQDSPYTIQSGSSQYDEGFTPPISDDPNLVYSDLNEYRAQAQTKTDRWANAVPRLASKFGTEVLKTPGYLYALGEAAFSDATMAESMNNAWINGLQHFDDKTKEQFEIYTPQSVKDGNLWDNISSASFWTNEGIDGFGYLASMVVPGAAFKAAGLAGKFAKLGASANMAQKMELGASTMLNTTLESLAETKGLVDALKIDFDKKINDGEVNTKTGLPWTREEADVAINESAKGVFQGNMLLLLAPNYIMNKNLLSRFLPTKNTLSKVIDPITGAFKEIAPLTKKRILGEYAKEIGIGLFSEGFVEEAGQMSIENYYKKLAKNEINEGLISGLATEYSNTLTSTEGQKAIFLGGVFGSLGAIRAGGDLKKEQAYATKLSKMLQENFKGFSEGIDGLYEKDENGVIKKDEFGHAVINLKRAAEITAQIGLEMKSSKIKDVYASLGNKEMFDYISNQEFTRFAAPYLAEEGGLEVLNKQIDLLSNKLVENKRAQDDANVSTDEAQYKGELKQKAKQLQESYNNVNDFINRMNIPSKGEEIPHAIFMSKLKDSSFQEMSKQMFLTDRINSLTMDANQLKMGSAAALPQVKLNISKIEEQIASYQLDLDESIITYEELFDKSKVVKAFDEFKESLKDTPIEEDTNIPTGFDDIMPDIDMVHAKDFKNKNKDEYNKLIELHSKAKTAVKTVESYGKINSVLSKIKKTAEEYLEEFKDVVDSPLGNYYSSVIKNIDKEIASNNEKINKLSKKKEEEKNKPTTPVLYSASKFTTMFTKFLSKEEIGELDLLSQADIYKNATIKIEDYEGAGIENSPRDDNGEEIKDTNVKIKNGLISSKLHGKGVYVYVNGKRVGALLDPRRYTIDGKEFNPGNMKHLQALNNEFVVKNSEGILSPSESGQEIQDNYKAMLNIFEKLEEKGEFTNDDVIKYFNVNRTGSMLKIQGPNKPSFESIINSPNYGITYSFNESGETITKNAVLIYRVDKEVVKYVYLKDAEGNITRIDQTNNGDEFNALNKLFNEHNKDLTGQFFVLINNPSARGDIDILSASLPSVEKNADESIVLDKFIGLVKSQEDKISELDKEGSKDDLLGESLKDENGNKYFISSKGINGARVEFGVTGRSGKRTKIATPNIKVYLPGKKDPITLFLDEKFGIGVVDNKGVYYFYKIGKTKEKSRVIKSTRDLIDTLNKRIKNISEAVDKKTGKPVFSALEWNKLKGLELLDFKIRVDNSSNIDDNAEDRDFSELNKLNLNYIPVRSSVSFRPVGVKKTENKKEKIEKGTLRKANENIELLGQTVKAMKSADNTSLEELYKASKKFAKENGLDEYNEILKKVYEERKKQLSGQLNKPDEIIVEKTTADRASKLQKEINIIQNEIDMLEISGEEIPDNLTKDLNIKEQELKLLIDNIGGKTPAFKISNRPTGDIISINEAKENLKKILPSWISTSMVDTIAANLSGNRETWGRFIDNVIYLSKTAGKGTEYHEAFHAVFRTILSKEEYNALLSEAKGRYSAPTKDELEEIKANCKEGISNEELIDLYYEERLADDFQEYSKNENNKSIWSKIWDKIKALGKFFYKNKSSINTIFSNIYQGVYKDAKPTLDLLRRSKNPAFKLIPKKSKWNNETQSKESGYLSQSQSERIINTIALNSIKKSQEPTSEDIVSEIEAMVKHYSLGNFSKELLSIDDLSERKSIADKIKEIQEALKVIDTQREIEEAVKQRIKLISFTDTDERDDSEDDASESGYVFNQSAFTIGGWGSLSKEMKQLISFTEINVDEFGFGNYLKDEEMKSSKFNMASNGFVIYSGIERALADTPKNKIFKKFVIYSNKTIHAKAFKDKFISIISEEIGITVDENTPLSVLQNSNWFNKFTATFNKNKVNQAVVIFDVVAKIFKAFKSNQRDESIFQFDEWSKNYIALGRHKEFNRESNKKTFEKIAELFSSSNTVIGKDENGNDYSLDSHVNDIVSLFSKMGITLSNGYVRHSLLSNKIEMLEKRSDESDFKELLDEARLFEDVDGLTIDAIVGILGSIQSVNTEGEKINNPFSTSVDEEGKVVDTGAIGRLKKIAGENAIFDESVTGSTFQNSAGDTVFDKILPSYLTTETAKWRDSARRTFIIGIRNEVSDEEGRMLLKAAIEEDGGYFEPYLINSYYQAIKNNPLILGIEYKRDGEGNETNVINYNDGMSNLIFDNLKVMILDGLRSVSFKEEQNDEGEFVMSEEGFKRSTGETYANLDPRAKSVMAMALFANGRTDNSTGNNKLQFTKVIPGEESRASRTRTITQFIFGVNEAKNTQNIVSLPIHKFTNKDGGLSSLGMKFLYSSFTQEYERITKANDEITNGTEFKLSGFHTKEKGKEERGLDFFNFRHLKTIDELLYNKIVESAKSGGKIEENFEKEITELLEKFYKVQFDKYVELLVDRGAIRIDKTTGEYKNISLPLDYVEESNLIDVAEVNHFFSNDYLNSLSFNNLLHGDLATNYLNATDAVKRNSHLIASGPSLGQGRTSIAVVRSIKASKRKDFDKSKSADINKLEDTDTTDGQNHSTLDWYEKKYLLGLGKSNNEIKKLISKVRRGYQLSWTESSFLNRMNASLSPRKIVGADTFFYDKTSIEPILRSEVSYVDRKDRKRLDKIYDKIEEALEVNDKALVAKLYKEVHNIWKPMKNASYMHFLLNSMEERSTDILAYDSSLKQIKPNVSDMPYEAINSDSFNWSNFDISDNSLKEQVNTDGSKKTIIHPTQLMNLVWSEQDLKTKAFIYGKEVSIKDVVDSYLHHLGERSQESFDKIRESIMEGNTPKYKKLLEEFAKSLEMQNSDPYLQEFFRAAEGISDSPKYNLNFPATLTKFENMWLSYVSKSLKIKTAGHKFTLITDFGRGVMHIGDKIITSKEFRAAPEKYGNVKSRRLEWRKLKNGKYFSECVISVQFAEQHGLKVGDTLPDYLLEMLGVRIPTQDKHSMISLKIVDFFAAETGNKIMLPLEVIALSGADFDIDSLFARIYNWYNNKYKGKQGYFGQYLLEKSDSSAVSIAHDEYLSYAVKNDEKYKDEFSKLISKDPEYAELNKSILEVRGEVFAMLDYNKQYSSNIIDDIKRDFEEKLEEAYREAFEFDEDDNYIQEHSFELTKLDRKVEKITKNLISDILKRDKKIYNKKIKEPLDKLLNQINELRKKISNKALENSGFEITEDGFSKKYGKKVIDNLNAYNSGNLEAIRTLNKGERDNLLLQMEFALLNNESERNDKINRSPSTVKIFDDADTLLTTNGLSIESKAIGFSSAYDKQYSDENNSTGKDGIGPAAVFNVMFQRLNKYKIQLRTGFESIMGFDNFSSYENENGERINDANSSMVSVAADNSKDPRSGRYNISNNLIGTVLNNCGMGMNPMVVLNMNKQYIIVEYNKNLNKKSSEVSTKDEKERNEVKIYSYVRQELLSKLELDGKFKEDIDIELSVKNLIEAERYTQGLSSTLSKEEYASIQLKSLEMTVRQKGYADFLRNLVDIMALAKGMKKTWSESEKVSDALSKLGVEIKLIKGENKYKLNSYEIVHVKGFKEDKTLYPFDILQILNNDKLLKSNILIYNMINIYAEKFFITKTKFATKIKEVIKGEMKNGYLNYEDNRSKFYRSLISFLSIESYKHSNNKKFKIDELFSNNSHKKLMSLLSTSEFKGNEFLNFLNMSKTKYDSKKKSIFSGLTLNKLEGNTRTKNNPDFVVLLMDGFRELFNSNNKEANEFVKDCFNYLLMKDNLQFKNNSFIRQIEPFFLSNISASMDTVQDLLSNDKTEYSFKGVFGQSEESIMKEFTERYTRDSTNSFYLRNVFASFGIMNKKMKDAISEKLTSKEEVADMSKEDKDDLRAAIDKSLMEDHSPFLFTQDKNGKEVAIVDIFKGTGWKSGVNSEDKKVEKVENSRLVKANISGILSIGGLFSRNEEKNGIVFPLIFSKVQKSGDRDFKSYYKLKSYKTKVGKTIKQLPADDLNGKSMHEGVAAIYEEVKLVGSKEIGVYGPFTMKDWDTFIMERSLVNATEEEEPDMNEDRDLFEESQNKLTTQPSTSVKKGIQDISSLGKLEGEKVSTEKGSIGVNKQQLMMLLGSTMYNKPLAQVAVKELLQNSFDGIKARQNSQKINEDNSSVTPGSIDIEINMKERTISIKDDGIGMTPDIVKNAFLSIGGTNKEGLSTGERSGGLGLAKVQFLMGSESIKVITIKNGIKTTIEATNIQLYNDDFEIQTEETSENNGTFVEVKIPKDYKTMEGTTREIDFPGSYGGWKSYDILQKPLIGNVNVNVNFKSLYGTGKKEVVPIGLNSTKEILPPHFAKISFAWGEADIYMSEEKQERPKHQILSSGIYQFQHDFRDPSTYKSVPYNIVVNIKPSVISTSEQYPFNNQREGFKNTVSNDISTLNSYLLKYARGESEKEAVDVFSDIKPLAQVDPNKILTPEERQKLYDDIDKRVEENKRARIEKGEQTVEEEVWRTITIKSGNITNNKTGEIKTEKEYKSTFSSDKEIANIAPVNTEFFNPAFPQFHNNTNVNYLSTPGAVEFITDFGNTVLQMVRFAGDELGYDYKKLATNSDEKFFSGVSIDKTYGGIHIRKIINAIFVNPLAFDPSNLEEAVGIALHITIHEINHTTASGEGVRFTSDLASLYGKIYATGKYGLYEGLFRSVYKKHFETFKTLKNEYDKSSTKNLSKSFEGNEIKGSNKGINESNAENVSAGQSSERRYNGDTKNTKTDRLGDVIASNLSKNKKIINYDKFNNKLQNEDKKTILDDEDNGGSATSLKDLLKKLEGKSSTDEKSTSSSKKQIIDVFLEKTISREGKPGVTIHSLGITQVQWANYTQEQRNDIKECN